MTDEAELKHPEAQRLVDVGLFEGLSIADLAEIASEMRLRWLDVGDVAVAEGGDWSKLFVVLDGNVTVHRQGRHLADLGPGDVFGEAGVMTKQARNATIIATTPTEVAVLMGWDFRSLIDRFPKIESNADSIIEARST